MDDLQFVEVSKSRGDLTEGFLRIEIWDQFGEGGRLVDEVIEGGRAEFEGDVEEGVALLFAEVSNDVGMVVRFLEEGDFLSGDGDKVFEESFDGDSSALELSSKYDGTMRSVA